MATSTLKVGENIIKATGPRGRVRRRVILMTGPGLTEQAHKKECDMNWILRDYQKTGIIRHAKEFQGRYDDVPAIDFQEAMFLVTKAQQMFDELPSSLRKRFANDPAQFMEFARNPENRDEMVKLGMIQGNDGLDATGGPSGAPVSEPAPVSDPAPAE